MNSDSRRRLTLVRLLIAIVIAGLVVSGVTAFPLAQEVSLLHRWLSLHTSPNAAKAWIATVHQGLQVEQAHYPFLAYRTDWLAFGHLVIALFFVGPLVDPVRNVWVIRAGEVACVLVIPLALICGEIREIPLW